MEQRKGSRKEFPFLVAIETDAQRPGTHGREPGLIGTGDAEQMLAHLAADLASLLGAIRKCRVVAVGAAYDQSQILRPGAPIFAALSEFSANEADERNTPGLLAIGAEEGVMPFDALQPDEGIPPALLHLLPLLLIGPEDLVSPLAEEMEHRFLAEGQVSPHTASWLESAFGIGISHARFMTTTDLNAMFRLQLEHFGYLPLWELIDAAVSGTTDEQFVTTANGTEYAWRDGAVRVSFQTFDFWANEGGGSTNSDPGELPAAYAEWCRELRRYTSTLAAHQVPLEFELPEGCEGEVSEQFLYEKAASPSSSGALASLTEHGWPELGTVAVTARMRGELRHYYPLTAEGLGAIHDAVGRLDLIGEGMAFPGTLKFSESDRRLRPVRFDA